MRRDYRRLFEDPDKKVREFALKKCVEWHPDPDEWCEEIGSLLGQEPDPHLRALAARTLGLLPGTGSRDVLFSALSDPSREVRLEALCALARILPESELGTLSSHLAQERDPYVRASLPAFLKGRGGEARLLLAGLMEDRDNRVKANAIEGLCPITSGELQKKISLFLSSNVRRLRLNSEVVLYPMMKERIRLMLARDLGAEDVKTRIGAAHSIGTIADRELLPLLLESTSDPSNEARCKVWTSIGRLGGREAAELLVAGYYTERNLTVRAGIEQALAGELREVAISIFTMNCAGETDPRKRATAVKALGLLGSAASLERIAAMTRDQDSRVRANALEGLLALHRRGFVRHDRLLQLIGSLKNDSSPRVRAQALILALEAGVLSAISELKKMASETEGSVRMAGIYALRKLSLVWLERDRENETFLKAA